jgi:hypothetical protein
LLEEVDNTFDIAIANKKDKKKFSTSIDSNIEAHRPTIVLKILDHYQ